MISRASIIDTLVNELKPFKLPSLQYEASFNRYFDSKYNFSFVPGDYAIFHLTLEIILKGTAYSVASVDLEAFDSANNTRYNTYYADKLDDRYLAKSLLYYSLDKYIKDNKFINDLDLSLKEIQKKIIEENKKKFISELTKQIDLVDRTELLDDSPKVHFYPTLILDGKPVLSLKVGQSRQYSVASFKTFTSRFDEKAYYSYGKELSFTHDETILDDEAKELLKVINHLVSIDPYSPGKFLSLSDKSFKRVLEIYKGKNITIEMEGKSYTFLNRLEPLNSKIYIDKDYVLSLPFIKLDGCVIRGNYSFDFNDKTIDVLTDNEAIANLIQLIFTNEYPCIEDNIEDFKYAYILRYPDSFIISPEVADDFKFQNLLINAYFDFENNIITSREELFVNNEKISPKQLTKYNQSQYRHYQSILKNMGFVDGNLEDQSHIWNFLTSSLDTLKKVADVYLSDSILNKHVSSFTPPSLKINYNNNLLDVFMENSRYSDDELLAIINGLRKKKKYILYKNQVIGLDNDASNQFLNNVDNYDLASSKELVKENHVPLYYAFKSLTNLTGLSLSEHVFEVFDQIKNFKDSSFKCGEIVGELRPYQTDGVRWLDVLYKNYLNGILADDMGLGKTIQIISFLKGEKIKGNSLIICPKTLLFNWQNEFMRFAPEMKVIPIYGSAEHRAKTISQIPMHKSTIYVSGYESVRRDEELYKDINFDTIILDEAQYIKNSKAKKSLTIYNLKSDHRFALTGTPIENSILDLWSIFNFLMPKYLIDLQTFKQNYEDNNSYINEVKRFVAPFILRRNKKDVLKDLPDKFETFVTCEMNGEQRKIYDAHVLLAKKALDDGGGAFDVLPYLMRLRQICIDPNLFVENYYGGSTKVDTLVEILNDRIKDGHRVLIFSQFVKALNLVKEKLNSLGLNYFVITGDTDGEERVRLANEFNSTKKYKVGLVSLKAGGTGLNLVGADVVIHMDPWWNVAVQDQATDRAYRIGQERNVEVIKLICEDSIEQRVVELQNIKKDLFDKVISNDDSSITSLTLEDINYILKA